MRRFYSNGKLFITGEYLVLDGAKAFALPTKFGQDLVVEPSDKEGIHWKSFDADGSIWFESVIAFESVIKNIKTSNPVENTLIEILHTAYGMNPNFVQSKGHQITTHLTFPRSWGLGTSSTLINNIAQWLSIDAYRLLWKSFGGSGYDIACAQHNGPLVYTMQDQKVERVSFAPPFTDHLYFVYLNQKQNSKSAIAAYRNKKGHLEREMASVDAITDALRQTDDRQTFTDLLEEHETILSKILEMPTVKQRLFPDFDGTVKSLGAWGGDFVLAVSHRDPTAYFKSKGYEIVVPYKDMIL